MRQPAVAHAGKPARARRIRPSERRRTKPRSATGLRTPKRTDLLSTALASGAMARLVTHFATRPDETRHVRALQRATGLSPRSLQTELARLVRLGILRRHMDGRQARYGLEERNPRWRALRALLRELAHPADVMREALSDVTGVDAAFLFGSYGRGTDIREGSDIDVFILHGDLSEDALARRTLDAGVLLGREVNVVTTNHDDLLVRLGEGSGFLRAVLGGPRVWVAGRESAIAAAMTEIGAGKR